MMRLLPVIFLSLPLILTSCATAPTRPVPLDALASFAADSHARITGDAETKDVFVGVTDPKSGRYGAEAVLRVNGKAWADLTRSQQDRAVRKAAAALLESCRPVQRALPPNGLCSVLVVDDLGRPMGHIIVGGTDPNGISYSVTR
jgi:hypothetical protein